MDDSRAENLKQRGNEKGITSATVATNVRVSRANRDLKTVSNRLRELGWPISVAALSRLENGDRRIDVDDLIALAVALGVSPTELLLPRDDADAGAIATGLPADVNLREAKAWAEGATGLALADRIDYWSDHERMARGQIDYYERQRESGDIPSVHAERMTEQATRRYTEALNRLAELEGRDD